VKKKQFRNSIGHPVYGFGLLPNPPGTTFRAIEDHPSYVLISSGSPLPPTTNNVTRAPAVWNQGGTSSCVGHGFACQITTTLANLGRPLPSPAEPRPIYTLSRSVSRSDPSTPLVDSGASPAAGASALSKWGIVLESEDDGDRTADSPDYSDYLAAHINDELTLDEVEHGRDQIVISFNSIVDDDHNKITLYQAALASGHAISAAVDAGCDKFQSYRGGDPLDYCGDDPDHFVCILDYQVQDDKSVLFLLQNSWGTGLWTPSGRAWVTSEFVRRGCFGSLVANLENKP